MAVAQDIVSRIINVKWTKSAWMALTYEVNGFNTGSSLESEYTIKIGDFGTFPLTSVIRIGDGVKTPDVKHPLSADMISHLLAWNGPAVIDIHPDINKPTDTETTYRNTLYFNAAVLLRKKVKKFVVTINIPGSPEEMESGETYTDYAATWSNRGWPDAEMGYAILWYRDSVGSDGTVTPHDPAYSPIYMGTNGTLEMAQYVRDVEQAKYDDTVASIILAAANQKPPDLNPYIPPYDPYIIIRSRTTTSPTRYWRKARKWFVDARTIKMFTRGPNDPPLDLRFDDGYADPDGDYVSVWISDADTLGENHEGRGIPRQIIVTFDLTKLKNDDAVSGKIEPPLVGGEVG